MTIKILQLNQQEDAWLFKLLFDNENGVKMETNIPVFKKDAASPDAALDMLKPIAKIQYDEWTRAGCGCNQMKFPIDL